MAPILRALWGSPLQGLRVAFDAAGALQQISPAERAGLCAYKYVE
jgi:hypothetical protein